MKAMALRTWDRGAPLEAVELPDPEPKAGEIRVRVAAIGVNPIDWKLTDRGAMRLIVRAVGPALPFVPGIDFAGTVDRVGAGVTGLGAGDRVVGGTNVLRGQRGSYAGFVVVRPDQVCRIPEGVDFETAGAMPVAGVTAWMSVVEVGGLPSHAERAVLVLGAAGGVGQFAVQIAKMQGARVVGVCSGRNAALVQGLGADAVVDYTAGDALAAARAHGPFSVVLDAAGGYSPSTCRSLLVPGGRHVNVADDGFGNRLQRFVPPFTSRTLVGLSTTARLEAVLAGMASGRIRVNVAERMPLAEAGRALAASRQGRLTGKLVLVP